MYKIFKLSLPLLFALTLSACTTGVQVDYETQQNFNAYQQFKLLPHTVNDQGTYEEFGGDIFETRLHRAIADNLGSKGLELSDSPDFLIDYSLRTEQRLQLRSNRSFNHSRYSIFGRHYSSHFDNRTHYSDIHQYNIGIITVKIIDAVSNKTVWTSTSKANLRTKKLPADAEAALRERVAEMLASFPPNSIVTL